MCNIHQRIFIGLYISKLPREWLYYYSLQRLFVILVQGRWGTLILPTSNLICKVSINA